MSLKGWKALTDMNRRNKQRKDEQQTPPPLMDREAAIQNRDAALERVDAAAPPEWKAKAYKVICELARKQ
jgi:hypothetical protein